MESLEIMLLSKRIRALRALPVLAALSLVLIACNPTTRLPTSTARLEPSKEEAGRTAQPGETFAAFPDIPVAVGSEMNVADTVVLGGEEWFGQLSINAVHNAQVMFQFYRDQLPKYGWAEISAVRAQTSVLTFDRGVRVLALQIKGNKLTGSQLTLCVAPRGGGTGTVLKPSGTTPAAGASGYPLAQPVQPLPPLTKSN